jgi:Tfp pilus assembly protein PilF
MRKGVMLVMDSKPDEALARFARAEHESRDPYVQYLAAYLRGVIMERRLAPSEAEAAYRRALQVSPRAQSASIALAAILAQQDKVGEARQLAVDMLRIEPPPPDPWREFVHADDRFWPGLIARLRRDIHR